MAAPDFTTLFQRGFGIGSDIRQREEQLQQQEEFRKQQLDQLKKRIALEESEQKARETMRPLQLLEALGQLGTSGIQVGPAGEAPRPEIGTTGPEGQLELAPPPEQPIQTVGLPGIGEALGSGPLQATFSVGPGGTIEEALNRAMLRKAAPALAQQRAAGEERRITEAFKQEGARVLQDKKHFQQLERDSKNNAEALKRAHVTAMVRRIEKQAGTSLPAPVMKALPELAAVGYGLANVRANLSTLRELVGPVSGSLLDFRSKIPDRLGKIAKSLGVKKLTSQQAAAIISVREMFSALAKARGGTAFTETEKKILEGVTLSLTTDFDTFLGRLVEAERRFQFNMQNRRAGLSEFEIPVFERSITEIQGQLRTIQPFQPEDFSEDAVEFTIEDE